MNRQSLMLLVLLALILLLAGCFRQPWDQEIPIIPASGNLLINPSADLGEEGWKAQTSDAFVQSDSGNPAFAIRNGSHFSQTVNISGIWGNYVVLTGISATQTIQANGMGNLRCFFNSREDAQRQFGKLDSPGLTSQSVTPNEWAILADFALIPRETGSITVFLDVTSLPGENHDGMLTWFDDIGLYIVETLQEAIDLVDAYIADHTW